MSVSVNIYGIIPADEKWQKMLKVFRECEGLGIEPPPEVNTYLGADYGDPQDHGREIDIDRDGDPEYDDGAIIDLRTIPEGVKLIRVFMS